MSRRWLLSSLPARITGRRGIVSTLTVVATLVVSAGPAVAQDVTLNPGADGMPGAGAIQQLLNWGGQLALWASLGALIGGGAMYGWATWQGRTQGAHRGQTLALGGATGALLVGLGPSVINLVYQAATAG